jgi:hypothetical protein
VEGFVGAAEAGNEVVFDGADGTSSGIALDGREAGRLCWS